MLYIIQYTIDTDLLFYTITMMDINIDIKNTGVIFQEFQDRKNNVIDITEARCTISFRVVKSPRPTCQLASVLRRSST